MTDEPTGAAPWQVRDKRRVYADAWINLEQWVVRLPDGSVIPDYTVVDYPYPAVGIVAVGDDGRVLLIDHYRVITGTRGWEIPAGRMEEGESVEVAGARELLEETGHVASRWETLGKYHPSNGSSNQVFHIMVARGLTRRSEPLDRNETMGLRWATPPEVRALIRDNAIPDGLTLTALGWVLATGVLS
jgi:8-oxo-dGTP pyrophosphatase MutT (NUDIX family)